MYLFPALINFIIIFFCASGVMPGQSLIHSLVMRRQEADRGHFRQQAFISLTDEAMSAGTVSYCENHSPRLLMVCRHNTGNISPSQEYFRENFNFIRTLMIYSTSSVMDDGVLLIKPWTTARILVILSCAHHRLKFCFICWCFIQWLSYTYLWVLCSNKQFESLFQTVKNKNLAMNRWAIDGLCIEPKHILSIDQNEFLVSSIENLQVLKLCVEC